jgi:hypothetical protein
MKSVPGQYSVLLRAMALDGISDRISRGVDVGI